MEKESMAVNSCDALRLDRQICFPLYAASNLMTRLYRPHLTERGLTYPQYLVMLVLWESASSTVGELGSTLYLDSGTLTPLLKRMEQAGLVKRRRDAADERRVLVELTAAGRALKRKTKSIPSSMAHQLNLPTDDMKILREALQGMVAVLSSCLDRHSEGMPVNANRREPKTRGTDPSRGMPGR
jgi:MarR family transcriptional regulator, organic hydroperoxide resistance regulator